MRARYYRPETGTFTTEDSYLGTITNPLTRNRYAYVSNNPLNYSDPTGHRVSAMTGAATGASAVTSARLATKLVNAAKAVTSPSAAQAPINAAKKSSAYRNAKKNQTNAQKAKNATTKIKSLTQRLREAHVKAFCTLDRAKVKTDWEKIGQIIVDGMLLPFRINMSILGAGLGKLGEFLSSPIVRAVASSIVEAAGALMVVSGIASVTAAATAGCK